MPTVKLALKSFAFPTNLSSDKANFRFTVDVRYIDTKDNFGTAHAVMPSLDTHWECDPGRIDNPNFVRGDDRADGLTDFDMDRIDDWDRLIIALTKVQSALAVK